MKKLAALLLSFLFFQCAAFAQPAYDDTNNQRLGQYWLRDTNTALPNGQILNETHPLPSALGGSGGTAGSVPKTSHVVTDDDETGTLTNSRQLVDGTNTTVDTSTAGKIKINASGGGGGSSPFAPAGFANVSTFNFWSDLAVSPDGQYVYVCGGLASNNHGAVAKVKVSDGSVVATCDIGGFDPYYLAVSPDGNKINFVGTNGGSQSQEFFQVTTSNMAIAHQVALANFAGIGNFGQLFDQSPDGTIFAYVEPPITGGSTNLHLINTSTYVVTDVPMTHTAGNLTAVCFYNGSNTNVYVAHAGSGDVDLYTTAGVYTSTVSTGAGGTPAFNAMRSGINGNFFIADSGTFQGVIQVAGGTPSSVFRTHGAPQSIAVNYAANLVDQNSDDMCAISCGNGIIYTLDYESLLLSVPVPFYFNNNGANIGSTGIAIAPNDSYNLFTLSGYNFPTVWSIPNIQPNPALAAGKAGNQPVSDGFGWWISQPPFSISGWTGTGSTIGGGGTVTVTCAPCTTGSIISITPTGTANVLPPAVTTNSNGSFVVTGTATGTFAWTLLKP